MKKLTDNEMVEFLQDTSSNVGVVLFSILMLVGGIGGMYLCFANEFSLRILLFSLIELAAFGLILWSFFSARDAYPKLVQSLKDSGEMEIALEDFLNAQDVGAGSIRFGKIYIFKENSEKLLRYDQITQVWEVIKKNTGIETGRTLKCRDKKGTVHTLCELERKGKSDDLVKKIMIILKTRNPAIHLGFK